MPISNRGTPNTPFAPVNRDVKQEISQMIDQITFLNIRRTADSILIGPNTHLDSRQQGTAFKVDIQYGNIQGPYKRKTIITVIVLDSAINEAEVREAFRKSLKDGNVYEVS